MMRCIVVVVYAGMPRELVGAGETFLAARKRALEGLLSCMGTYVTGLANTGKDEDRVKCGARAGTYLVLESAESTTTKGVRALVWASGDLVLGGSRSGRRRRHGVHVFWVVNDRADIHGEAIGGQGRRREGISSERLEKLRIWN